MQYCELKTIVECKIKPADFQIFAAPVATFSKSRTLQKQAYASNAKLKDKESLCQKSFPKWGYRFDLDNWYVNIMKRPFSLTAIEARGGLARVGFI